MSAASIIGQLPEAERLRREKWHLLSENEAKARWQIVEWARVVERHVCGPGDYAYRRLCEAVQDHARIERMLEEFKEEKPC